MNEVPSQLMQLLVCPQCHGALVERREPHRLDCARCALGFPVRDGIPIMLVDEAESLAR